MFKKILTGCTLAVIASGLLSCADNHYLKDRDFLESHVDVIELSAGESRVLVAPQWQGRIMTATPDISQGLSTGWINYNLISSGKNLEHMNPYGGLERFWVGPEGGQYSLYFKKGSEFSFDNWQVPALIDTEAFDIIESSSSSVEFGKRAELTNYSGTEFVFDIKRKVSIFSRNEALQQLNIEDNKDLNIVMTESENTLINRGAEQWKQETGLISIWILSMFQPGDNCAVVVPLNGNDEDGSITADYFGVIPSDRLNVSNSHLFLRADGEYRSKIGVPYLRSSDIAGSYDSDKNLLTLVYYNRPPARKPYVNSLWKLQDNPYGGDVINAYNDGSPGQGQKPLGPFYEIETSSAAYELKPDESMVHRHRILQITGPEDQLNEISVEQLGCSLEKIKEFIKSKK